MLRRTTTAAHRPGTRVLFGAVLAALVVALGACAGGDTGGTDGAASDATDTQTEPDGAAANKDVEDTATSEDDGGDGQAASLGAGTVTVDGEQFAFDVVACVQDLVVPEADGTVVATFAGAAPGTPEQARRAIGELVSFGNGLASSIESVLPALEDALGVGPVVAFERFESTDGGIEDRVRVVQPDGTTLAATGQLDVTVDDAVEAAGTLPAVRRSSGQTPTPYEGTSAGELTLEASCG